MSQASDRWYVRLPDGQVFKARNTAAVRHLLENGRIPTQSRVRRPSEVDWTTLDWTKEFADLANQPRRPNPRLHEPAEVPGPGGLRAGDGFSSPEFEIKEVGLRGLVEELLTALDTSLARRKLLLALLAGLAGGLVRLGLSWLPPMPEGIPPGFLIACEVLGLAFVGCLCAALITQMTLHEITHLRPATWREARWFLGRHTFHILIGLLVLAAVLVLPMIGLQSLQTWALETAEVMDPTMGTSLATVALGGRLLLAVLLWPFMSLALFLVPIVIAEEVGLLRALRLWVSLLRQHLGRAFLYQALALAVAGLVTLPVLLPVMFAAWFFPVPETLGGAAANFLTILTGLALAPFFVYLVVANLLIYLMLRYEYTLGTR